MERKIYSVTETNYFIKNLLDNEKILREILIRGEISNFKIYPSGHWYFSLKDAEGSLRCVMFRGQAEKLRFQFENGMSVIASGRIGVFVRDGAIFWMWIIAFFGMATIYAEATLAVKTRIIS